MENYTEELVRELSQSDDQEKLISVISRLAETADPAAVKPLINLLKKTIGDYHQRAITAAVVEALGKLGARDAEDILVQALSSYTYFIKAAAAEALGHVAHSSRAFEDLEGILDDGDPAEVKHRAIEGLKQSDADQAVDVLTHAARFSRDRDVRREALEAVEEVGSEPAVTPLMEMYYSEADTSIRKKIIAALARIASSSSLGFLIRNLTHKNPEIRACSALALGRTGNPDAAEHLRKALDDPEWKVREHAAMALGLIEYLPLKKHEESGRPGRSEAGVSGS